MGFSEKASAESRGGLAHRLRVRFLARRVKAAVTGRGDRERVVGSWHLAWRSRPNLRELVLVFGAALRIDVVPEKADFCNYYMSRR